jgi:hypothetical protein
MALFFNSAKVIKKVQRHNGAKAQRHNGTTAQRHKGSTAQRHKGATAQRRNGSKAQRLKTQIQYNHCTLAPLHRCTFFYYICAYFYLIVEWTQ